MTKTAVCGVYRAPSEVVEYAKGLKHPIDNSDLIEERLTDLVKQIANLSADELKAKRLQTVKEVCRRRLEPKYEEEKLEQS